MRFAAIATLGVFGHGWRLRVVWCKRRGSEIF